MSGTAASLRVPLYFDFASSLCFVAHRVLDDLAEEVAALGVELDWRPIDLAALRGLRRGATLTPAERARIDVVAGDLGVPLRVPPAWIDSRPALAAAAEARREGPRATSWRERVFSAIYEEARAPEDADACLRLATDLEWPLTHARLAAGGHRVEADTEDARDRQVTGVPTFQLGRWPFGGIQHRDTLLGVLGRFARKARAGALEGLDP